MKNYISINDRKIELPEEQVGKIMDACGIGKVRLKDVQPGSVITIGETEFVVLEQIDGEATAMITRDLVCEDEQFGSNNNFDGSNADDICRRFGENLEREIGEENLLTHDVDLTSDDGLKDYGTVARKASLLTCDLYRRYVKILDKYKPGKWWWLATPLSTKTHGITYGVKCVAPSGYLNNNFNNNSGVRPFCILNSDIFVSFKE
jgi:hypothetical protein